mmetsp:Transcript_23261/g.20140  ORF Transcript_23261/g.20140 Transcript_23261/m.20140 type:complete len:93 (+) Transcript_23261:539-817(+)
MLNFYALDAFKEFVNTPLYIFGESFAGHYIPAIGKAIIQHNQQAESGQKIPIDGVGIGNGWTDPINQFTLNDAFGYSMGLLSDAQRIKVQGL